MIIMRIATLDGDGDDDDDENDNNKFLHRIFFPATCIGPLGMESGVIQDNQIQSSSSFEHASVGPHNAR